MKVDQLTLRSFRNITECSFNPDPHLNFLIGANGQGKTSILEALGLFATLRSFKGSKTTELIRWGSNQSDLVCKLSSADQETGTWETQLKLHFEITDPLTRHKASKTAFINDKMYKSSTHYLSQRFGNFEMGFHAVIFNPSDHDLIRGEPTLRRSFLDRVLAAEDIGYLKSYQKYQKVVEQRNAVLKQLPPQKDLLMGFSEPMGRLAAELALKRMQWLQKLNERLNDIAHQIAPQQPDLRIVYCSNWVPEIESLSICNNNLGSVHFTGQGSLPSLELLEQEFWKKVSNLEAAEWRSGHSMVGPHRDDWAFYLGGQPLKGHGSQGEVRSALLALKLCEIELFRRQTGHRPLFLLDDFSSELDRERRNFLLRFLTETDLQVFVTTTEDFSSLGKRYRVSDGNLREEGHDYSRRAENDRGR